MQQAVPATTVDSPLPDMCPRRSVASQRLVEASPAPEVTEAQYQAVKKYVTRCFEVSALCCLHTHAHTCTQTHFAAGLFQPSPCFVCVNVCHT